MRVPCCKQHDVRPVALTRNLIAHLTFCWHLSCRMTTSLPQHGTYSSPHTSHEPNNLAKILPFLMLILQYHLCRLMCHPRAQVHMDEHPASGGHHLLLCHPLPDCLVHQAPAGGITDGRQGCALTAQAHALPPVLRHGRLLHLLHAHRRVSATQVGCSLRSPGI